jgi:hypothetical protein
VQSRFDFRRAVPAGSLPLPCILATARPQSNKRPGESRDLQHVFSASHLVLAVWVGYGLMLGSWFADKPIPIDSALRGVGANAGNFYKN